MYIGKKRLPDFKVSQDDLHLLNTRKKWNVIKAKKTAYVARTGSPKNGESRTVFLHRLVMNAAKGEFVDHKDGDGLNNLRSNLRIATTTQNNYNKGIHKKNQSGFKGVYPYKGGKRWRVCIFKDGKQIQGGYHDDKIEAAKIFNELAIKHFGEFARLNVIPQ